MKRISLIILVCLFCHFISGYSQLKMTRYLYQKDFLDYGSDMFTKTTVDLYKLALSGKIKVYTDSGMRQAYTSNQINQRVLICEKVKSQSSLSAKAIDTTVCLPLDYDAVPIWLKIKTVNEHAGSLIAICCDSAGKAKILFYIYMNDISLLDPEEGAFLLVYWREYLLPNSNGSWATMNQRSISQYMREKFAKLASAIKGTTPAGNIKIYTSDSLTTFFTPETYHAKKEQLAGFAQNFDVDSTICIFIVEKLLRSEESYTISEYAIGIGGYGRLGSSSFSDMPFFYLPYKDFNSISFTSDAGVLSSISFISVISQYQIYKSINDMSWH